MDWIEVKDNKVIEKVLDVFGGFQVMQLKGARVKAWDRSRRSFSCCTG